jgi:hypothetical protein
MRYLRLALISGLFFVVGVAPIVAQERGFVAGNFGLTFAENTAGSYGATVGVNVTPAVQIVGLYSHMNNVLTGGFAELLDTLSGATDLLIEGELPVDYGAAGVRFNVDAQDIILIFFQLDAGAARVGSNLRITDPSGQDVTDGLAGEQLETTRPAVGITGGARVDLGSNFVAEASFKWLNVNTEDEPLRINRLDFGIGIRF